MNTSIGMKFLMRDSKALIYWASLISAGELFQSFGARTSKAWKYISNKTWLSNCYYSNQPHIKVWTCNTQEIDLMSDQHCEGSPSDNTHKPPGLALSGFRKLSSCRGQEIETRANENRAGLRKSLRDYKSLSFSWNPCGLTFSKS